ncbi:MAG: hypothetical protein ACRD5L_03890, partial [Bryobacteraceae bacterium]
SEREWSPEYLQKWHDTPQTGSLGTIPGAVLARAKGGYGNDLDIPAAQLEKERMEGARTLAQLSSNSKEILVASGHNVEIEAPEAVSAAIREVAEAVRAHRALQARAAASQRAISPTDDNSKRH